MENLDQIIAFVHWGDQYKSLPNDTQKNWFDYFRSLGVNIVIGSHPHVLQPMEWQPKTDLKKESLVVYSLGNFISHQRTFPRDGGAVLKLSLKKKPDDGVEIKSVGYHLTWVHEFRSDGKKYYDILFSCCSARRPILKRAHAAAVATGNKTTNNLVSIIIFIWDLLYWIILYIFSTFSL